MGYKCAQIWFNPIYVAQIVQYNLTKAYNSICIDMLLI